MGLVFAIALGLIAWIVLWALDVSGFDGFLVTVMVALLAATVHMLLPYLPGRNK